VKATSHPRTSVAGFDLTFTPPKSVSALWAVADPRLAAAIRVAHNAAVAAAMTSAERRVVFTRQGHDGVRHVEVRGLLAAVFVHRDSRAGDPNLHTHVAIATKCRPRPVTGSRSMGPGRSSAYPPTPSGLVRLRI
jgi:conjugative relaxase-like TrwC/TraI family protein